MFHVIEVHRRQEMPSVFEPVVLTPMLYEIHIIIQLERLIVIISCACPTAYMYERYSNYLRICTRENDNDNDKTSRNSYTKKYHFTRMGWFKKAGV